MILTKGQAQALKLFDSGENLLLLGDPGTGKSTLISAIVQRAEQRGKRVAKTASTGIAAQLIGGRTIHSLLQAYPGKRDETIDYEKKASNLEEVEVLIIDEISMLGKFFIQYLYECLKHVGHHVQLIVSGDFFQLPPVKDNYAFLSPCWKLLDLVPCILTEVIRQKDAEFVRNIQLLKFGNDQCIDYLLSHSSSTALSGQISICATKRDADLINHSAMEKLAGKSFMYLAEYEGVIEEADLQVEKCMILKAGMRVMSVINGIGYSNGSLGTVVSLDPFSVEVLFDNSWRVCFGRKNFTIDRRDIPGKTTELWQIPVRPAYAITIHKSQGQTFQYVNIDGTKCWAPGQLYVAVSRACKIEGIHFLTPIKQCNIKTDPVVVRFYEQLERTVKRV